MARGKNTLLFQIIGGIVGGAVILMLLRLALIGYGVTAVQKEVKNLSDTMIEQARHRQEEQQKKNEEQRTLRQQQQAEALAAKKKAEEQKIAQAAQEERLSSYECRFWWDQHKQNPTERTATKKAEACGTSL